MARPFRLLALLLPLAAATQSNRPVVAVGGIMHETNTFNPKPTTYADFEVGIGAQGISRGAEIVRDFEKGSTTTAGVIAGAKEHGLELFPTLSAGPQTLGTVKDDAFDKLCNELIERLVKGPGGGKRLAGVILTLHGTMVTDKHAHADAEVVRRVRQALGPAMPIVVTHDFHANVSEEIVKLSNALITYKENPHLDSRERGLQAAGIMARMLRGEVKPTQALYKPPLLYNLVFQNTYQGPMKAAVDESKRLEKDPRFLAVSVPGGYQWADIPAMGPSVVVVTNNDMALAQREAKRIGDMLVATRDKLKLGLPDPATAVRTAMKSDKFPVTLMDTGDNIGGGSAGDSTFLLDEFIKQKATGWFIAISDPQAVTAAFKLGINGKFDMPVGGKTDTMHGKPVRVRGRVKSLHDGRFVETEVRHGGMRYWDMGLTAIIEVEGSTEDLPNIVQVTTKRVFPASIQQLVSCGVYPSRMRILVAKGTVAPRAAFEPVSAKIVEVDTPGSTSVNPARFTFKRAKYTK